MNIFATIDAFATRVFETLFAIARDVFYLNAAEIYKPILMFYLVMLGFAIWRGAADLTYSAFMKHTFTLWLVGLVGFDSAAYMHYIYDFFTEQPAALAGFIFQQDLYNIASVSDTLYNSAINAANAIYKNGGTFAGIFLGGGFALASVLIFGYIFYLYLMSKMSMLFLLALGPFFFFLLLFDKTAKIFESFIQQLINYALLMFFILVYMAMVAGFLNGVIAKVNLESPTIDSLMPVLLTYLLLGMFAGELKTMSATISGNFHVTNTQGFQSLVASMQANTSGAIQAARSKMSGIRMPSMTRSYTNQIKR